MRKKIGLTGLAIAGLGVILAAMFVVAADLPAGRAEYSIPKITCGSCSATISKGLGAIPGVTSVDVDIEKKLVRVSYDEQKTNPGDLALELGRLGYPGSLIGYNGKTAAPSPGGNASAARGGCGGGCCSKGAQQ